MQLEMLTISLSAVLDDEIFREYHRSGFVVTLARFAWRMKFNLRILLVIIKDKIVLNLDISVQILSQKIVYL